MKRFALIFLLLALGGGCLSCGSDTGIGTTDNTPPLEAEDLRVRRSTHNSITWEWRAAGDDWAEGRASAYLIRTSPTGISRENWHLADPVEHTPAPAPSGSIDSLTVTGLEAETSLWLGVRIEDDAGNQSDLRTSRGQTLADPPPPLPEPPPVFARRIGIGNGDDEPGEFDDPQSIALDRLGNLFVVDQDNHRVQKFSEDGEFLLLWGGPCGSCDWFGDLARPTGIAIHADHVYVTDAGKSLTSRYDLMGAYERRFGGGLGVHFGIKDVAVDSEGNVFVVEEDGNTIHVFSPEGQPIRSWGKQGAEPGQLFLPRGIAIHLDQVYLTEAGNHRVQVFSRQGGHVLTFGEQGEGRGQFESPRGVTVDDSGCIYVVSGGPPRVQKFNAAGQFLSHWGMPIDGGEPRWQDGELSGAQDVAVSSDGRTVYVVDVRGVMVYEYR